MGGGGSTSTSGTFAPEVRGLFQGSSDALLRQQRDNPIGGFNYDHPLDVAGADPMQEAGAQLIGGGANPTGLDALTLQSIMRAPGLAGAGPTTGQYDYASEPGLQDLMQFLNPSYAKTSSANAYTGNDASKPFTNEQGTNAPIDDYRPLTDVLNRPSATQGGGAGGPGAPGQPGTSPGSPGGPRMAPGDEGAQFYKDWNGQIRRVETGRDGQEVSIAGHGKARYDDKGFLNPLYEQGSQGLATSPNQQRAEFGKVWDSDAAKGTAANASWQHPTDTMSLQDLMASGGSDAAYGKAFQNRLGPLPSAANNWGRGNNPAPAAAAAPAKADTPEQAAYRAAQADKKKAASKGTTPGGGSPIRG